VFRAAEPWESLVQRRYGSGGGLDVRIWRRANWRRRHGSRVTAGAPVAGLRLPAAGTDPAQGCGRLIE
jgi:hypothetical protein